MSFQPGWRALSPSPIQRWKLDKLGIKLISTLTRGEVSDLISETIASRPKLGYGPYDDGSDELTDDDRDPFSGWEDD